MEKIKITDLQKNVLDCLAKGLAAKEAAVACNCSVSYIKQISANEDLRGFYSDACYNIIRKMIPRAITELHRLIEDLTVMDTVKIAAIKQVFEVGRVGDTDRLKQDINITVVYE